VKFGNLSKPFVDLGFGIIYHQVFLTLSIRTFLTQSIQNQLIRLVLNANEEFGLITKTFFNAKGAKESPPRAQREVVTSNTIFPTCPAA
jgi:hypothetical protein